MVTSTTSKPSGTEAGAGANAGGAGAGGSGASPPTQFWSMPSPGISRRARVDPGIVVIASRRPAEPARVAVVIAVAELADPSRAIGSPNALYAPAALITPVRAPAPRTSANRVGAAATAPSATQRARRRASLAAQARLGGAERIANSAAMPTTIGPRSGKTASSARHARAVNTTATAVATAPETRGAIGCDSVCAVRGSRASVRRLRSTSHATANEATAARTSVTIPVTIATATTRSGFCRPRSATAARGKTKAKPITTQLTIAKGSATQASASRGSLARASAHLDAPGEPDQIAEPRP